MAKGFNQAIVVGNLTQDPELRTTSNGRSVASFSVATNRRWTDNEGERQERVEFHNIVAWQKLGELVDQYLNKGSTVMVVGRLQTRSWETDDGSKRYRTEIVARDVNFLDSPGASSRSQSSSSQAEDKEVEEDVEIEDLDEDVDLSEIPF